MSETEPQRPQPLLRRLSGAGVGTLLAMTIGVLLVLAVVGIGLALIANGDLTHNRNLLLERVGPARRAALSLENALLNEETGVRGYVITANRSSLAPYREGRSEELKAYAQLRAQQQAVGPQLAAELTTVRNRAEAWRTEFVAPALADPRLTARSASDGDLEGKQQFDALRASLASLRDVLEARDTQARDALQSAAERLRAAADSRRRADPRRRACGRLRAAADDHVAALAARLRGPARRRRRVRQAASDRDRSA